MEVCHHEQPSAECARPLEEAKDGSPLAIPPTDHECV
jgi:hypothetical protein